MDCLPARSVSNMSSNRSVQSASDGSHSVNSSLESLDSHAASVDSNAASLDSNAAAGFAFPGRLHKMLRGVEAEGLSHIVSWQPPGRCFVVHKPKEFVRDILHK
jgi:hypothetical protein